MMNILTSFLLNGLVINKSKCGFGVTELDYLGHKVTIKGNQSLPDRIKSIQNSHKLAPLHLASSGRGKSIEWSQSCQEAFDCAKSALASCNLVHHPRANAIASTTVDASDVGLSVQLEQLLEDTWVPIAFFSRKLSSAERNCTAFDRELLAAYAAIRTFAILWKQNLSLSIQITSP